MTVGTGYPKQIHKRFRWRIFFNIGFTHHSVILGKIKEIDERITNY